MGKNLEFDHNRTSEFLQEKKKKSKKTTASECLKEIIYIFIHSLYLWKTSLLYNVMKQNTLINIAGIELKHDHHFFDLFKPSTSYLFFKFVCVNTWITVMSHEAYSNFILKLLLETIILECNKKFLSKKKKVSWVGAGLEKSPNIVQILSLIQMEYSFILVCSGNSFCAPGTMFDPGVLRWHGSGSTLFCTQVGPLSPWPRENSQTLTRGVKGKQEMEAWRSKNRFGKAFNRKSGWEKK